MTKEEILQLIELNEKLHIRARECVRQLQQWGVDNYLFGIVAKNLVGVTQPREGYVVATFRDALFKHTAEYPIPLDAIYDMTNGKLREEFARIEEEFNETELERLRFDLQAARQDAADLSERIKAIEDSIKTTRQG